VTDLLDANALLALAHASRTMRRRRHNAALGYP